MAASRISAVHPPRLSVQGLGLVAAAHLLVLVTLAQLTVLPLPAPLAVLSVSLLPPAPIPAAQPEIALPRPRPVATHPPPPPPPVQPLVATPDAPSPAIVAVVPAPTLTASRPPLATAPVTAPAAPPAVPTPPRLDADYLDNPKPSYPPLSRRLNEQGRVVLRVHVAADGSTLDVLLHSSSGHSRLDNSALAAVRRWKFAPARLGQDAVAAWVRVPIEFSLQSS